MAVKSYVDETGRTIYYNDDSIESMLGPSLGALLGDPLLGLLLSKDVSEQANYAPDMTDPVSGKWTGDVGGQFPTNYGRAGSPDFRDEPTILLDYYINQGQSPEQANASVKTIMSGKNKSPGVEIANINKEARLAAETERTTRAKDVQAMKGQLAITLATWENSLEKYVADMQATQKGELTEMQLEAAERLAVANAKAEFRSKPLRSVTGSEYYPTEDVLKAGEADIESYFKGRARKFVGKAVPEPIIGEPSFPPAGTGVMQGQEQLVPGGAVQQGQGQIQQTQLPPEQKVQFMALELKRKLPNMGPAEINKIQNSASFLALTPEEKQQLLLLLGVKPRTAK